MPILADQADMAARVGDAGVGVHLSKSTFSAEEMLATIQNMLEARNATSTSAKLARARAAMLLSGGVERAVGLIEHVAAHGVSQLVPIHVGLPWYVQHHVDVYVVWAIFLGLSAIFWHFLCCKARPGKECVQSRKEIRAASNRATTRSVDGASRSKAE